MRVLQIVFFLGAFLSAVCLIGGISFAYGWKSRPESPPPTEDPKSKLSFGSVFEIGSRFVEIVSKLLAMEKKGEMDERNEDNMVARDVLQKLRMAKDLNQLLQAWHEVMREKAKPKLEALQKVPNVDENTKSGLHSNPTKITGLGPLWDLLHKVNPELADHELNKRKVREPELTLGQDLGVKLFSSRKETNGNIADESKSELGQDGIISLLQNYQRFLLAEDKHTLDTVTSSTLAYDNKPEEDVWSVMLDKLDRIVAKMEKRKEERDASQNVSANKGQKPEDHTMHSSKRPLSGIKENSSIKVKNVRRRKVKATAGEPSKSLGEMIQPPPMQKKEPVIKKEFVTAKEIEMRTMRPFSEMEEVVSIFKDYKDENRRMEAYGSKSSEKPHSRQTTDKVEEVTNVGA